MSKRVIIISLLIVVLILGIAGVALAQDNGNGESYGESCDGSGHGLQNCWGRNAEAGSDLQNCWMQNAGASSGLQSCCGGGAQ